MKKIPNMFDIPYYLPPPLQTMCSALMEMSGCVVSTNTNGGNSYGNNKNKKERKERFCHHKGGKRGADIRIGREVKRK